MLGQFKFLQFMISSWKIYLNWIQGWAPGSPVQPEFRGTGKFPGDTGWKAPVFSVLIFPGSTGKYAGGFGRLLRFFLVLVEPGAHPWLNPNGANQSPFSVHRPNSYIRPTIRRGRSDRNTENFATCRTDACPIPTYKKDAVLPAWFQISDVPFFVSNCDQNPSSNVIFD